MLNKENVRVSVPQENAEKFKEVLLHIFVETGDVLNVTQATLCKILYFVDFDYYERYEEQLIGAEYIKDKYGPNTLMFVKIINELERESRIKKRESRFYDYDQVNFSKEINMSTLSSQELDHVNWEIDRLGSMPLAQISKLSRLDTPWAVAEEGEPLKYEHVFYRSRLTSVRKYEEL